MSSVLPISICRDYNTPLWCSSENCEYLHICKYYVYGRCRKGEKCNRLHGVPDLSNSKLTTEELQKALVDAKLPEGIPTPRHTVVARPLRRLGRSKVYFDLETTGVGVDTHIIQIAAVAGYQHFNRFVKPIKPIDFRASKLHQFKVNKNGQLTRQGIPVPTISIFTALNHFLNWLSQFNDPILIAHNCKAFDARVLVSALKATKTFDRFKDIVVGFLDSYTLAKQVVPQLRSFTLENIYYYYRHCSYPPHDALNDSRAVSIVVNEMDAPFSVMLKHTFDCVYVNWANRALYFRKIAEASLHPIVKSGLLTKALARKIATSGLDMDALSRAFELGKIKEVMDYNIDSKPRVAITDGAVGNLEDYFKKHKSDE